MKNAILYRFSTIYLSTELQLVTIGICLRISYLAITLHYSLHSLWHLLNCIHILFDDGTGIRCHYFHIPVDCSIILSLILLSPSCQIPSDVRLGCIRFAFIDFGRAKVRSVHFIGSFMLDGCGLKQTKK